MHKKIICNHKNAEKLLTQENMIILCNWLKITTILALREPDCFLGLPICLIDPIMVSNVFGFILFLINHIQIYNGNRNYIS